MPRLTGDDENDDDNDRALSVGSVDEKIGLFVQRVEYLEDMVVAMVR